MRCHKENMFGKYWGVCNDYKRKIDECFKKEKIERVKRNRLGGQGREEMIKRETEFQDKFMKATEIYKERHGLK